MTAEFVLNEAIKRNKMHGSRPDCGLLVADWYEKELPDAETLLYVLGFAIDVAVSIDALNGK